MTWVALKTDFASLLVHVLLVHVVLVFLRTACPAGPHLDTQSYSPCLSARSGLEQTLDLRVEIHGDREC
jgi:hypothetical protein